MRSRGIVAVGLAAMALLAAATSAMGAASEMSPFSEAYRQLKPAVVRVLVGREYSTGLVVTSDGLIVTHSDVITKNEQQVLFADGLTGKSKMLLRDPKTKIAVLQLVDESGTKPAEAAASTDESATTVAKAAAAKSQTWKTVTLGSTKGMVAGDLVATVAYPTGSDAKNETEPSLSIGIVTGRGPLKTALGYEGEVILTDAMMNSGSEGGALVDDRGRVVGILAEPELYKDTRTALNFALPADLIAGLLKRARENPDPPIDEAAGRPKYGYMGVATQPDPKGLAVVEVVKGGPADKAGLAEGDIIARIGDKKVTTHEELVELMKKTKPGDKVRLRIIRPEEGGEDKEFDLDATLGEYPKD